MENKPWNDFQYTRVLKVRNDPRFKDRESPYTLEHVNSSVAGPVPTNVPTTPDWFASGGLFPSNTYGLCRNKAISKVEDKLTMFENLFEAFYERQEAITMLRNAGKGIFRFLTNWRKPKYWRSIMKGAKRPETLPEAWLMYNFGLKPLISSIDSAIHLLGGEIPPFFVRASSGCEVTERFSNNGHYSRYNAEVKGTAYAQFRVWIQPDLNPNRGLLNVMGLTTPFSTMLSVVPWAWAVDYFVNLSEQLANFEDRFPGVEIREVWETNFFSGDVSGTSWNHFVDGTSVFSGPVVHVRRHISGLNKGLVFNVPIFGSGQLANLFSAIALTMKGKQNA